MLNDFLLDVIGALNSVMPADYVHAIFFRSVLAVGTLLIFLFCVSAVAVALVVSCCRMAARFIK